MDKNRPKSRQKNITEGGKSVHRRGEGLHTGGPVGNAGGYQDRGKDHSGQNDRSMSAGKRGPGNKLIPLILAVVALLGGGTTLTGLLGDGSDSGMSSDQTILSSFTDSGTNTWSDGSGNTGELDTSVASAAREKRTVLKGNGEDIVTIMIYMCGTDLESKSGMATADLQEMSAAQISDNVNLIVYTGGCSSWRNKTISSNVNQIYQVKDGGLTCLVSDAGSDSMTNPDTLSSFIQWCGKHFPANRNELIFWDHGGGSATGYGYDQKYPRSGSMDLAGINKALKAGGMSFDFIGFDACLMATMENALMLSQYGDYLLASEETEPGVGWYYTDWLTKLSGNTSVSTLEIGKQIIDDFVNVCNRTCRGQQTTLSLIDLAELEKTGPEALSAFAKSTGGLIQNEEYQTVSNARYQTREFAKSSGIDQVDLIHLAENIGTDEGKELSSVLKNAVKYNKTSANMTNAYGVSIYFPYKKISSLDKMVQTYEAIGMDEEYSRCIRQFASLEIGGQVASGGTSSPLPALLGGLMGGGTSSGSSDAASELLQSFLSGNLSGVSGLIGSNTNFLDNKMIEESVQYLTDNQFDASQLIWKENSRGQKIITLEEDQWDLIQNLELNVFYDDGEGYIDLGMDNVFEFDDEGNLIGDYDHTWLAINGQPVAYYFLDMTEDGETYSIHGRVPAMLNGQRVDLMLTFDNENPNGYIAGARTDYDESETETVAKGLTELQPGDRLDFLCDYYSYEGNFRNNYYLGETMTVESNMIISNVDVGDGDVQATYRLTDIYNQHYWTLDF